jgi:hypothetical protein
MRQDDAFNNALMTAIDIGLAKLYSLDNVEAIKFVADPRMALGSGRAFAAVIEKMFSSDSRKILKSIEDSLCELTGTPKREWGSLEECIAAARLNLDRF